MQVWVLQDFVLAISSSTRLHGSSIPRHEGVAQVLQWQTPCQTQGCDEHMKNACRTEHVMLLLLLPLPAPPPVQVSLKYFEEVFTSQHWMMRIYRVRDTPNRDAAKDSGRAAQRKATKKAAA
jgi:hypothetical protein